MSKIAIVTDSNSGISQKQAGEIGAFVVPMPVNIGDETYYEGIDIDRDTLYRLLSQDISVSTSQPLPGDICKLWDDLLTNYEEIIYIPMSSSLSRSYETAVLLSQEFGNRVHVVNNQRISVTQRQSVVDALEMVNMDFSGHEIKEVLEKDRSNASIYITLNTLDYIKKGGRLTPAAAAIGTILKIKPVLQIQGGLLDSFAKARTMNSAKKIMFNALKEDAYGRFKEDDNEILVQVAHTCEDDQAELLKEELQGIFPGHSIYLDHLPLSITCHIGPGAFGIGCIKKLNLKSLKAASKLLV